MQFKITSRVPEDILTSISEEIERRRKDALAKEASAHNGSRKTEEKILRNEVFVLSSLLTFLRHTVCASDGPPETWCDPKAWDAALYHASEALLQEHNTQHDIDMLM